MPFFVSILQSVKSAGIKVIDNVAPHSGELGSLIDLPTHPEWKHDGLWYFNGKILIGPFNEKGKFVKDGDPVQISPEYLAKLKEESKCIVWINAKFKRPLPGYRAFYYFTPRSQNAITKALKAALEWSTFGMVENTDPTITF